LIDRRIAVGGFVSQFLKIRVGQADTVLPQNLTDTSFSNLRLGYPLYRISTRPHERSDDPKRYLALDAVRGIAAVVVLVYHSLSTPPAWSDVVVHGVYRTQLTAVFGRAPLNLLWDGRAAVNVFFALSGFVLALMFLRDDPPGYLASRESAAFTFLT
jgi:hypothetical protein